MQGIVPARAPVARRRALLAAAGSVLIAAAAAAAQPGESPARQPESLPLKHETVAFPAPDGLIVTADLWAGPGKARPFVLLCHQARSSRGEYRAIAPRLVAAGFDCLAIDQRSGQGLPDVSAGVRNETAARARAAGQDPRYEDAQSDIEAAIAWIRRRGHTGRLTLWGSSYSAALAFVIAARHAEVDAVVAFSPGEYVGSGDAVAKAAAALKKPVLIVAPQAEKQQANAVFEAVAAEQRTLCVHPDNRHGSRTLFLAENPEPAWDAVLRFLRQHGRGSRRPEAPGPREPESRHEQAHGLRPAPRRCP